MHFRCWNLTAGTDFELPESALGIAIFKPTLHSGIVHYNMNGYHSCSVVPEITFDAGALCRNTYIRVSLSVFGGAADSPRVYECVSVARLTKSTETTS